uniref:(California timema) hypothetical protein n=1 Tax=Timema californicum TaxID=61474 RepID=A0A7R9P4L7_TIMCA|nr:unnamed protein product [Timema californicum]
MDLSLDLPITGTDIFVNVFTSAGLKNVQKRDRQESSDSDEDFAHDTSDLSSHTELSDDGAVGQNQVEYEVVTASEDGIPEISSESDDASERCVMATATIIQNNSDLADTSGDDDTPSGDPELSLADYWTCCMCKTKKNNPMYRYCEKCFRPTKLGLNWPDPVPSWLTSPSTLSLPAHQAGTQLARPCSKLVGFGSDQSPVSHLHQTWFPLWFNPTGTSSFAAYAMDISSSLAFSHVGDVTRPSRLKKRTARNKRLKQKSTKSHSFCSTVILTSDKSDLEKDLCSASSVSFSSLDKQTDPSSLGSSHKPHVCMMDADSTEDLPKHRVVTLCDPSGCSTDKMNEGVDRVDWGVDCVDGGADRVDGGADCIDTGLGRVDGVDCVDGVVDCVDEGVSYIEGRPDTAVTSLIDATDSGKGSSQDTTENYLQCSFQASQELSQKSSLLQCSFSESQELSQKSSLLQYSFSESQELSQKSSLSQYSFSESQELSQKSSLLQCSFSESQELSLKRSVGTMTSSQDPMCITCLIRPINASFIHGKNTHTVCCYKCARIIERTTRRCENLAEKTELQEKAVYSNTSVS